MVKNSPVSSVPQLKGVVIPEIVEDVKSVDHYRVGDEVFLVKSRATKAAKALGVSVELANVPIKVFSVGEDDFLTPEEAEKKLKSVVKKHRDKVREIANLFKIKNASSVDKNPSLVWLLETYEVDEIKKEFDIVFVYGNQIVCTVFKSLTESLRLVDDAVAIGYSKMTVKDFVGFWSWMRNRNVEAHWGFVVPTEYQKWSDQWYSWRERFSVYHNKMGLITCLINFRFLELLCLTGNNNMYGGGFDNSDVSLQNLMNRIDLKLIVDEVRDLYAVMDQAELGSDLRIEFKNGEVVYAVNGDPKLRSCFKRF